MIGYNLYRASFSALTLFFVHLLLDPLVIYVLYRSAPLINRALGKTGMNIVTRIMELITMAIAVQFMADGLKALFPVWQ